MMQSLWLLLKGHPTRKNALIDKKPDIAACREQCARPGDQLSLDQRAIEEIGSISILLDRLT